MKSPYACHACDLNGIIKLNMEQEPVKESQPEYISREAYDRGIFGQGSNLEVRYISDYEELANKVDALRTLGLRIVLTSGTFDIIHIGHAAYLEKARQHGDVLIVGVDSDEKVRSRKGPNRPVVPQAERIRMLSHLRDVDIIAIKDVEHYHWQLIKTVRPDTLIATQDTYDPEEVEALKEYCGRVVVLPPQAETSTTARIRRLHVDFASRLQRELPGLIDKLLKNG